MWHRSEIWCSTATEKFYVDDLSVNCTINRAERRHKNSAKTSQLDRRWQRWKMQRIWQLCTWWYSFLYLLDLTVMLWVANMVIVVWLINRVSLIKTNCDNSTSNYDSKWKFPDWSASLKQKFWVDHSFEHSFEHSLSIVDVLAAICQFFLCCTTCFCSFRTTITVSTCFMLIQTFWNNKKLRDFQVSA